MSTVTVTHHLVHCFLLRVPSLALASSLARLVPYSFLRLLLLPLDLWLALAGVLSLDELRQGLADVGITDEQIDQLSFELDTDQDGKVLLNPSVHTIPG